MAIGGAAKFTTINGCMKEVETIMCKKRYIDTRNKQQYVANFIMYVLYLELQHLG